MQYLLNTLTILAFFMSAITWILTTYNQTIRTTVSIIDYKSYSRGIVQFYLYIQNDSEKAFTISGISLLVEGNKYPCELTRKDIRSVNNVVTLSTPAFPLNFTPLQGRMEFIEFVNCPDIELTPDKMVEIEIYTNRKRLNKFLKLPQQGQCRQFHSRNS